MMDRLKKRISDRRSYIIILIILLGLVSSVFTYSLSSNTSTVSSNNACEGTCVSLRSDKASPETVAVARGSYVQFNAADGKSHSLSLGEGGHDHEHKGSFHSGTFKADEAWRVQFNDEGTFQFHDHLNPDINILVVVYEPGKDYKIEKS